LSKRREPNAPTGFRGKWGLDDAKRRQLLSGRMFWENLRRVIVEKERKGKGLGLRTPKLRKRNRL